MIRLALAAATACGGDAFEPVPCEEGFGLQTDQGCRGVEHATLCGGRTCVPDDAACERVHTVASQDELAAAAAKAAPGECLALAEGEYGPVAVRGGVSLLGRGAAHVTIQGRPGEVTLAVSGGEGGLIRGVRIRGGDVGLLANGTRGLRVEEAWIGEGGQVSLGVVGAEVEARAVRIDGDADADEGYGVQVDARDDHASLRIEASWIADNRRAGLVAVGGASVEMTDTVVEDNGYYGVALYGGEAVLERAAVRGNRGVGVLAGGARVEMRDVEVAGSRMDLPKGLTFARLLEAQDRAEVEIRGDSRLSGSEHAGIVVDDSRFSMEGGEVRGNADRGLWIQRIGSDRVKDGWAVRLRDVEVADNALAGVGATEARGVVVEGGPVTGTRFVETITEGTTVVGGEGVLAVRGAQVTVQDATIERNQRAQVLFDASPDSDVQGSRISASGGEAVGLVIQNMPVPEAGFAGTVDASGAAVEPTVPKEPLDVASDALAVAPALKQGAPKK